MKRAIVVVAAVALGACGWKGWPESKAKSVMSCNPEPSWWARNELGQVSAQIHVCFGTDGTLYWTSRQLPVQPPTSAAPVAAPAPAVPAASAKPAAEKKA